MLCERAAVDCATRSADMSSVIAVCDVLIVDDDAAIRSVLTMVFEEEGFAVETASNGHDALGQLQRGLRPAVILLDWLMPRMNGAEFRAAQRQDAELAGIPVVVMSAHLEHENAQGLGADRFFPKPLDYNQLVETVSAYCHS
jgi:CheY-like chemotaxis protein